MAEPVAGIETALPGDPGAAASGDVATDAAGVAASGTPDASAQFASPDAAPRCAPSEVTVCASALDASLDDVARALFGAYVPDLSAPICTLE